MSVPDVLSSSPSYIPARTALSHNNDLLLPKTINTPDVSPTSNLDLAGRSQPKKVEFLTLTNSYDASTPTSNTSAVKSLPPSRECQSTTKSILKISGQFQQSEQRIDGRQEEKPSLTQAMESIVQQLAKNEMSTSIDAYTTLLGIFKTYDEIPEENIFKNEMTAIMKHVRRDLTKKEKDYTDPADTTITIQALKVLNFIVWSVDLLSYISEDYKCFILDHAIYVLAEHAAPKSILVHYLHLLATQNFRAGLMLSNSRAIRLLDALEELRKHVKGNNVTSERLALFTRLLDQAKSAMTLKPLFWVDDMLQTMTSSVRDMRTRAISLGVKACSTFPASTTLANVVHDLLMKEDEMGKVSGTLMCRRLEKMTREPDERVHVPHIWSITMLLISGKKGGIAQWNSLTDWLKVIQRCFNSGETAIRFQTYYAWNRFVRVVRPHESSDSLVSILVKPIIAQLDRPGGDKESKSSRPAALSSYCNLLYYAFRPAASHKQYSRVWNAYIVKFMTSSFFDRNPANADFACRVFIGLLWNSTGQTKIWKENRAHQNIPVEPEELPTIDCKWVRNHCADVLQMFRLLLARSNWGPSESLDKTFIATCWCNFAKALAEASSKEIKPSVETKQAISCILQFVEDLRNTSPKSLSAAKTNAEEDFTNRMHFICRVVIVENGILSFLEMLESHYDRKFPFFLAELISFTLSIINNDLRAEPQFGKALTPGLVGVNARPVLKRLLNLLDRELSDLYTKEDISVDSIDSIMHVAIECLRTGDRDIRTLCLTLLTKSACSWLRDERRGSSLPNFVQQRRTLSAEKLRAAIVVSLGEIQSSELHIVDEMLTAAFCSTHSETIISMVQLWNKTHGCSEYLNYPPMLTEALLRIRPHVDLMLPNFEKSLSGEEINGHSAFTKLTDSEEPLQRGGKDSPCELSAERHQAPSDAEVAAVQVHVEACQQLLTSPDYEAQAVVTTPSSRRNRHDDSQIQFVPIDSSPAANETLETQHLTERQKEVRDRQRTDATVFFSDLRSSPHPRKNLSRSRSCDMSMQQQPATPVLPPQIAGDDEDVAALSPTPRRKNHAIPLEDTDMPSSPPSLPGVIEESFIERDSSVQPFELDGMEDLLRLATASAHENAPSFRQEPENTNKKIPTCQVSQVIAQPHPPHIEDTESTELSEVATTNSLHDLDAQETSAALDGTTKALKVATQLGPQRKDNHVSELGLAHNQIHKPRRRSPTNSDELDMLSASQLSQDLDWHVTIETLDSPILPIAEPERCTRSEKRKRSVSNSSDPTTKRRRKSTWSLSPEPVNALTVETELQHCVADDMAPKQVILESGTCCSRSNSKYGGSVTSQSSQNLAGTKRKRRTGSSGKLQTEVHLPAQLRPEGRISLSSANHDICMGVLEHQQLVLEKAEASTTLKGSEVETAIMPTGNNQQNNTPTFPSKQSTPPHMSQVEQPQAEEDIMSSLQKVLDRLKRVNGQQVNLRAIDDLCFDIRTEAQNAYNRHAMR